MSGERHKGYLVLIARRQLHDYLLDNDVTQVLNGALDEDDGVVHRGDVLVA
jgi:hypothetical protein